MVPTELSCATCVKLDSHELNVCRGCGPTYVKWEAIPMRKPQLDQQTTQLSQVGGTHYLRTIQPFDIIRAWDLGFFRGNVVKYVLRCTVKNDKEDLMKARHYLDYCIENYAPLKASGFF